jgi:hypothetical protein
LRVWLRVNAILTKRSSHGFSHVTRLADGDDRVLAAMENPHRCLADFLGDFDIR